MVVALTYRDLIWHALDKLNAKILESILGDWNPPDARTDASTFVARKIGDLDVGVEEIVDPAMASKIGYVAERVNAHGATEFKRVIGIPTKDTGIEKELVEFRARNVDLIKSLAKSQLGDISDVLEEAEKGAWQSDELRKALQERFRVTKSKADLLARDQTLKLNGQLTMTRQKNAGVKKYIWTTSRDERVRPMHEELDGTIQEWSNPPIVSVDGRRCHPGDDYQCRCTAFPILEELEDELDPEFAPDTEGESVFGYHPLDTSISIAPFPKGPTSLLVTDLPAPKPLLVEFGIKPLPATLPQRPQTLTFKPPPPIVPVPVLPTIFALTQVKSSELGIKPEIEVPKDVQRNGFEANYRKVKEGVADRDLDYLRDKDSFRSFDAFEREYQDGLVKGRTPNEITLDPKFPPIKLDLNPDGKTYLRDGRHRWTIARKYGATKIKALVRQYGPKGGIRWEKEMVIDIIF